MSDINKYKQIIHFHYSQFQDGNLSGDKHHLLVIAKLIENEFLKYVDYALYCSNKDIAAVSEGRWKRDMGI